MPLVRRQGLTLVMLLTGLLVLFLAIVRPHLSPTWMPTQKEKPNRLVGESSPYLLQHAYNLVDWYPWGEEAFQRARREQKPIFLSVGYSTCHWCHVMERESFSNQKIADILNRLFISVKVDREERPDVDKVYMAFIQATTGGGGWPMSVFLTPELKPFFGGTYFPPKPRGGQPGFAQLLQEVASAWEKNRGQINDLAHRITEQLRQLSVAPAESLQLPVRATLDRAFDWYRSSFDREWGGFGRAPKFPRPVNFFFLHRYARLSGKSEALEMSLKTLRQMARGSLYDHLGGGFHRYSTDERWFLPHFEKMVYDQALLAIAYLEAFQLSQDPQMAQVARGIFTYLLQQMRDRSGGFFSAEDADSAQPGKTEAEKVEGAFYVWSYQDIERLLGDDTAPFAAFYGVKPAGNVAKDPFGEFTKKNLLYKSRELEAVAQEFALSPQELQSLLKRGREKLFKHRRARPRPLLDDKILASWNGLVISALARGGQVLGDDEYITAARQAARFLLDRLYRSQNKQLLRRSRQGQVGIPGFVDDYVFVAQGLLDLYETTFESEWLLRSFDLMETAGRLFLDTRQGGFFQTSGEDPSILLRQKEDYDGAEPAPSSVAALTLLRLGQISGSGQLTELGNQSIQAFRSRLKAHPSAMPLLLAALHFQSVKPKQILIVGDRTSPDTRALLKQVHQRFLPNKVIVLADGGEAHRRLASSLEVLSQLQRIGGKATAYVCRDYVCNLPTNSPAELGRQLDQTVPPTQTSPGR